MTIAAAFSSGALDVAVTPALNASCTSLRRNLPQSRHPTWPVRVDKIARATLCVRYALVLWLVGSLDPWDPLVTSSL